MDERYIFLCRFQISSPKVRIFVDHQIRVILLKIEFSFRIFAKLLYHSFVASGCKRKKCVRKGGREEVGGSKCPRKLKVRREPGQALSWYTGPVLSYLRHFLELCMNVTLVYTPHTLHTTYIETT